MDAEPPHPAEGTGEPRIVPFIRLRCADCRRARGAYLLRAARGVAGLAARGAVIPVCPHHQTIWAPGEGPGSSPPRRPGRDTRPPPV